MRRYTGKTHGIPERRFHSEMHYPCVHNPASGGCLMSEFRDIVKKLLTSNSDMKQYWTVPEYFNDILCSASNLGWEFTKVNSLWTSKAEDSFFHSSTLPSKYTKEDIDYLHVAVKSVLNLISNVKEELAFREQFASFCSRQSLHRTKVVINKLEMKLYDLLRNVELQIPDEHRCCNQLDSRLPYSLGRQARSFNTCPKVHCNSTPTSLPRNNDFQFKPKKVRRNLNNNGNNNNVAKATQKIHNNRTHPQNITPDNEKVNKSQFHKSDGINNHMRSHHRPTKEIGNDEKDLEHKSVTQLYVRELSSGLSSVPHLVIRGKSSLQNNVSYSSKSEKRSLTDVRNNIKTYKRKRRKRTRAGKDQVKRYRLAASANQEHSRQHSGNRIRGKYHNYNDSVIGKSYKSYSSLPSRSADTEVQRGHGIDLDQDKSSLNDEMFYGNEPRLTSGGAFSIRKSPPSRRKTIRKAPKKRKRRRYAVRRPSNFSINSSVPVKTRRRQPVKRRRRIVRRNFVRRPKSEPVYRRQYRGDIQQTNSSYKGLPKLIRDSSFRSIQGNTYSYGANRSRYSRYRELPKFISTENCFPPTQGDAYSCNLSPSLGKMSQPGCPTDCTYDCCAPRIYHPIPYPMCSNECCTVEPTGVTTCSRSNIEMGYQSVPYSGSCANTTCEISPTTGVPIFSKSNLGMGYRSSLGMQDLGSVYSGSFVVDDTPAHHIEFERRRKKKIVKRYIPVHREKQAYREHVLESRSSSPLVEPQWISEHYSESHESLTSSLHVGPDWISESHESLTSSLHVESHESLLGTKSYKTIYFKPLPPTKIGSKYFEFYRDSREPVFEYDSFTSTYSDNIDTGDTRSSTFEIVKAVKAVTKKPRRVKKIYRYVKVKRTISRLPVETESKQTNTKKIKKRTVGTDSQPTAEVIKARMVSKATETPTVRKGDKETNTTLEGKKKLKESGTDPKPEEKKDLINVGTDPEKKTAQSKSVNTDPIKKVSERKPASASKGTQSQPVRRENKETSYDKVKTLDKGTDPTKKATKDKGQQFEFVKPPPVISEAQIIEPVKGYKQILSNQRLERTQTQSKQLHSYQQMVKRDKKDNIQYLNREQRQYLQKVSSQPFEYSQTRRNIEIRHKQMISKQSEGKLQTITKQPVWFKQEEQKQQIKLLQTMKKQNVEYLQTTERKQNVEHLQTAERKKNVEHLQTAEKNKNVKHLQTAEKNKNVKHLQTAERKTNVEHLQTVEKQQINQKQSATKKQSLQLQTIYKQPVKYAHTQHKSLSETKLQTVRNILMGYKQHVSKEPEEFAQVLDKPPVSSLQNISRQKAKYLHTTRNQHKHHEQFLETKKPEFISTFEQQKKNNIQTATIKKPEFSSKYIPQSKENTQITLIRKPEFTRTYEPQSKENIQITSRERIDFTRKYEPQSPNEYIQRTSEKPPQYITSRIPPSRREPIQIAPLKRPQPMVAYEPPTRYNREEKIKPPPSDMSMHLIVEKVHEEIFRRRCRLCKCSTKCACKCCNKPCFDNKKVIVCEKKKSNTIRITNRTDCPINLKDGEEIVSDLDVEVSFNVGTSCPAICFSEDILEQPRTNSGEIVKRYYCNDNNVQYGQCVGSCDGSVDTFVTSDCV